VKIECRKKIGAESKGFFALLKNGILKAIKNILGVGATERPFGRCNCDQRYKSQLSPSSVPEDLRPAGCEVTNWTDEK
jgi:hypothetical protein